MSVIGQQSTPDTQEGSGAENQEQEQLNTGSGQAPGTPAPEWTPENAAAAAVKIKELTAENAKWHKRLRETERAKEAEAEAAMAEQGKYKELYQQAQSKAARADALQERLDAITAQAQSANERRVAAIPDAMKSLVPEYDDPLKLAEWLDANAAVFSRPTPPPLDGRAGGNGTPAVVTEDEVNEYAARWGLDARHIDRAQLAKVIKR